MTIDLFGSTAENVRVTTDAALSCPEITLIQGRLSIVSLVKFSKRVDWQKVDVI